MTAKPGHSTATGAPNGSRYHLDSRIATGGMGEVWRATDTVLDREVAVKVLKTEYADDPTFRSRFGAEARHAAALHHPHVASVFDFGELPDDDGSGTTRPFLVMELVPGQPLSALLQGGEPMPPGNAADLVAQAADAIAAAHAIGIVHRDVKPANLLVTPEGEVKITDFGIARAADAVALTQTGQIVGTPHYISPEQAEGRTATKASDIYALGVVLYECLAGHRPFVGATPVTTALAHLREPVPPLPGNISDHLRAVVDRALAKDPDDRFGSAADMANALRGGPVAGPGSTATAPAGAGAAAAAVAPATAEGSTEPLNTRVVGPHTAGSATDRRRVLPPWWPWVAAAAGVLLVVGLAMFLGGRDAGNIAGNTAGNTEGNTAGDNPADTQSVQPKDDRVRLRQADYVGMDHAEAKKALDERGFEVKDQKKPATSPDQEKDTVASARPSGLVEPGATITLTVWEEYDEPEQSEDDSEDDSGDDPGKGENGPSDKGDKHGKAKGKK